MTPFLLIPGLNCTARVFRDATHALWPLGPVTIASTLEGEGMTGMATAILRAAPPTFALVGFSMGGYLCFEILRQAPERVTRLALIDTTARPDTPEATEVRRRRIAQTRAGKFSLAVEQAFATSAHPDHVDDAELRAIHRDMALGNGPDVYVRHQEAIIARPDSRPILGTIQVPTVVIVGEGDQITRPHAAREMREGIPGSELAIIPNAGHLALLEQPAAVNTALLEWAQR